MASEAPQLNSEFKASLSMSYLPTETLTNTCKLLANPEKLEAC